MASCAPLTYRWVNEMEIILEFDREDGPLQLDALLGKIEIIDSSRAIKEECTYIDSWLDALIRGIRGIQGSNRCVIDLIDEPNKLIFENLGDSLQIGYGDMCVNAGSLESFTQSVKSAASFFLDIISKEIGHEVSELTEEIRKFVDSPQSLLDNS